MSRAMQNITDVFRCSTQLRAKSTGMCLDWPSRCQWPPRSWRPTPTRSQPSSSTPSTRESSHEDVKLQFLDLNKRTCIETTLPSFVSSVSLAFDQITTRHVFTNSRWGLDKQIKANPSISLETRSFSGPQYVEVAA